MLLVGGADLDPRRDGWMLHPTIRCQDQRRESFDRCLARKVAERRMPVFGIGAGLQLLNVTQGGNLYLHEGSAGSVRTKKAEEVLLMFGRKQNEVRNICRTGA